MNNDDDILGLYLKDINRTKIYTPEEQSELAVKAAAGDKIAKEKLIKSNLRFVIREAKKYRNYGLDLVDLISEGNIGLMTAINHFDASRGYHFISYAVWWIRQAILKAICEKSRAIRLPLNRANELVQIERARKSLTGKRTETQEIHEIAGILKMDPAHVREMIAVSRDMVSLDSEINDAGDHTNVSDFVEDTRYAAPDEHAISTMMHEDINSVLSTLKPKEARVLRLRYGIDGTKPMSLKEVGDVCNLTKERIRQIEKNAIKRMQHPQRMRRLAAYVA